MNPQEHIEEAEATLDQAMPGIAAQQAAALTAIAHTFIAQIKLDFEDELEALQ